MRNFCVFLFFFANCSLTIDELIPNIVIRNQLIKPSNEKFYIVKVDKLMQNSYYKIMVHYLGPVIYH